MSTALSVYHGRFGRACLYQIDRPMTTHAHREGHLIFAVQGAPAAIHVNEQCYPLTAAQAVAVNPWEPHDFDPCRGYESTSHPPNLFLTLYIKPIWFLEVGRSAQSALRFGQSGIEITQTIQRSIQKVVTLLLESGSLSLFDGYLYELTKECFDQSWQWSPNTQPLIENQAIFTDYRVRKSIKLMVDKIGSEIVLDDIAREAGLSRPHFYKLFRKQTGITPNLYLNTLRMEKAIDSLIETDKTITDIGFDLGFSCQSGFTRFFTLNVGMPPSDYRRVAHTL